MAAIKARVLALQKPADENESSTVGVLPMRSPPPEYAANEFFGTRASPTRSKSSLRGADADGQLRLHRPTTQVVNGDDSNPATDMASSPSPSSSTIPDDDGLDWEVMDMPALLSQLESMEEAMMRAIHTAGMKKPRETAMSSHFQSLRTLRRRISTLLKEEVTKSEARYKELKQHSDAERRTHASTQQLLKRQIREEKEKHNDMMQVVRDEHVKGVEEMEDAFRQRLDREVNSVMGDRQKEVDIKMENLEQKVDDSQKLMLKMKEEHDAIRLDDRLRHKQKIRECVEEAVMKTRTQVEEDLMRRCSGMLKKAEKDAYAKGKEEAEVHVTRYREAISTLSEKEEDGRRQLVALRGRHQELEIRCKHVEVEVCEKRKEVDALTSALRKAMEDAAEAERKVKGREAAIEKLRCELKEMKEGEEKTLAEVDMHVRRTLGGYQEKLKKESARAAAAETALLELERGLLSALPLPPPPSASSSSSSSVRAGRPQSSSSSSPSASSVAAQIRNQALATASARTVSGGGTAAGTAGDGGGTRNDDGSRMSSVRGDRVS